jgi:hypothetical protein
LKHDKEIEQLEKSVDTLFLWGVKLFAWWEYLVSVVTDCNFMDVSFCFWGMVLGTERNTKLLCN